MAKGSGMTRGSSPRKESLIREINTLAQSPLSNRSNDRVNPIPYAGKDVFNDVFFNQDRWYDNKIGTQSIEISKLETIQPIVLKSTLMSKIDNSKSTSEIPVVLYNGRYILQDGNHTVAIKKLRGDRSVRVTLYRYR